MYRYLTKKSIKAATWEWIVGLVSVFFGVFAFFVLIGQNPTVRHRPFMGWLATLIVIAAMLLPLFFVLKRVFRRRRARKYAQKLDKNRSSTVLLSKLDRILGDSNSPEKLNALIEKGYLQNIDLDFEQNCLRLPQIQEDLFAQQQAAVADTGNEVYNKKLKEIRALNDEIHNYSVSRKIDRIENLTTGIFQVIQEKPDRAQDARRFMNYYLPTTLKLLESYKLMEKQRYQGENIVASREKIENTLDILIRAIEHQHDKLFSSDVLDVETDITVLETMMASDGVEGSGITLPR